MWKVSCSENLFILEGDGGQMVENEDGSRETRKVGPGTMSAHKRGQFHSTRNIGDGPLRILATYEFSDPEIALREDPACQIQPPKNA